MDLVLLQICIPDQLVDLWDLHQTLLAMALVDRTKKQIGEILTFIVLPHQRTSDQLMEVDMSREECTLSHKEVVEDEAFTSVVIILDAQLSLEVVENLILMKAHYLMAHWDHTTLKEAVLEEEGEVSQIEGAEVVVVGLITEVLLSIIRKRKMLEEKVLSRKRLL